MLIPIAFAALFAKALPVIKNFGFRLIPLFLDFSLLLHVWF
jgi:hypothetical protein